MHMHTHTHTHAHAHTPYAYTSLSGVMFLFILVDCTEITEDVKSNAQYTILLPGKALHLTALNNARKFRNRGNKEGGLQAFRYLEIEGLGYVEEHIVPGQKAKVCIVHCNVVVANAHFLPFYTVLIFIRMLNALHMHVCIFIPQCSVLLTASRVPTVLSTVLP